MIDYQYDRHQLSHITGTLIHWVNKTDPSAVTRAANRWTKQEWSAMQLAILMQGVGPLLYRQWQESEILDLFPIQLQGWLAEQYDLNSQRLERMRQELLTILLKTNAAGIPVMPLKGGLIAWQHYPEPGMRPMADLDLFILPQDRETLIHILRQLNYEFDPADSNEHAQHIVFQPVGTSVVSVHGEHPDNPRPVEVHWRLQKGVWGALSDCDFTRLMWSNAREQTWYGLQIWQPDPANLCQYMAFHAAVHLIFYAGRIIQWIDLTNLCRHLRPFVPAYPSSFYPVLRLIERALPNLFCIDLDYFRTLAHPRAVAWADQVPLDGRCGLTLGPPPFLSSRRRLHWSRWWPSIWRMRLGYYDSPLATAYARHARSWFDRLWAKQKETRDSRSPFNL